MVRKGPIGNSFTELSKCKITTTVLNQLKCSLQDMAIVGYIISNITFL